MIQNYNIIVEVRFPSAAAIRAPIIVGIVNVARFLHVRGFRNFVMFPRQNTNNKYLNGTYIWLYIIILNNLDNWYLRIHGRITPNNSLWKYISPLKKIVFINSIGTCTMSIYINTMTKFRNNDKTRLFSEHII